MLSISKISEMEYERKQKSKIDSELPYFITIVTLLSSAGIGPYFILEKLKSMQLLPTIRDEAHKMLKRIDLLGLDPLTVMSQTKDRSSSKALGEFFGGYVATIESGGDIMNYLKNKMSRIFDRHTETQKQSVVKMGALVEAYMTVQVVLLAVYIISAAMVSQTIGNSAQSGMDADLLLMIVTPIVTFAFIFIAHKMSTSKTPEIALKKILMFTIPSIVISLIIIELGILPDVRMNPYLLGVALIAASVWPAIHFKKMYAKILASEEATPKILRTITEARKTGMSPESCVIHACERKDYGLFNELANGIANKIKWGVEFKNIFTYLKKEVQTFDVLISFNILFELISAGGGDTKTLDSLAETSEKMHEIQKSKRDLLKPYLLVGFILMGTTGFTTLLVTDSFGSIAEQQAFTHETARQVVPATLGLFPIVVLLQSWTAGLFLGKVINGAYSGGFLYSIILIITTLIGITLVQFSIIDVNALF